MTDYIEREAALKRLCKEVCNVPNCECDRVRCPEWFAIHDAPAADVRPNVPGKWLKYAISFNDGLSHVFGFKCSACGGFCMGESNFCPNCGAQMMTEDSPVITKASPASRGVYHKDSCDAKD